MDIDEDGQMYHTGGRLPAIDKAMKKSEDPAVLHTIEEHLECITFEFCFSSSCFVRLCDRTCDLSLLPIHWGLSASSGGPSWSGS